MHNGKMKISANLSFKARMCESDYRETTSHSYDTWLHENCTEGQRFDNGLQSYVSECGAVGSWNPKEQSCRAGK